jgi:hypothetical protein
LSDLPSDLHELYAQVGIAAECAQVLEVEAGNLAIAYLTLFVKPGQEVSPAETAVYRAVIEDVNRKTLGAMFRHIRGMATIDPALVAIMDNFAIQGAAGRATMLEDIECVSTDLRRGHQVLSAMTDSINQIGGHGKNPNAVVEKLVQRGKRIDI